MKILFLFASENGFQRYLPILQQLLSRSIVISILIATHSEDIDHMRKLAYRDVNEINPEVLFAEYEFVWLGVGHTYAECILGTENTVDDILKKIQKYAPMALA